MKKRRVVFAVGVAAVLAGGTALAAKVGDVLFIKAKNTKVLASASPTADVVAVLQPGEPVKWGGADAANAKYHKVDTKSGKSGVVFQSDLSPNKPSNEVIGSEGGKSVDAQAFASSGAATKALGESAKEYGQKKDMGEAVADLSALEDLSKKVTLADAADHAKKAGLFPVVGDKP